MNQSAIRELVLAAKERWEIPALSVAVARPGLEIWSEGFGVADLENDVPAAAETVYRLASISKPITATAVMQLYERGRLDLDAPVKRYVPSFPEKPWPITCRLLLSHLSGIRDWNAEEIVNTTHFPYGSVPLETFLATFKTDDLLHEPGSKFRYTTHGYNLLGCIVEAVAGLDYLSYVRDNVFAPADLVSTFADDAQAIIPHRARGYAWNADKSAIVNATFCDNSDRLPGGGFCGTAADVVRFGRAIQSGVLVSSATLAQIFTRQKTTSGQDPRFGIGWFLSTRNGEVEAAHGGKHFGTSTMLYLRATSGVVVTLLTNLQDVPAPFKHGRRRRSRIWWWGNGFSPNPRPLP